MNSTVQRLAYYAGREISKDPKGALTAIAAVVASGELLVPALIAVAGYGIYKAVTKQRKQFSKRKETSG